MIKTKKGNVEIQKIDVTMQKEVSPMNVVVVQEEDVVNDRVVKKSVRREVDARDNFKDYRVSDFYMENLIAAGAVPTNSVQYYDGDIDKVLNYVDGLNSQLDGNVKE